MDYFDLEYLNNYVAKYKNKLINKIPKIQFDPELIIKQKDLLSQVLEYSPNVRGYSIKDSKKIQLKVINNNSNNNNSIKIVNNENNNNLNNNINNIEESNNNNKIKKKDEKEQSNNDLMNFKSSSSSSEDDDDEYEKLMQKRQLQMEQKLKTISEEDSIKVKVYLLKTVGSYEFQIKPTETSFDLKQKIINYISDKNLFNLKNTSPNAYELRLTEEDEELPNMNIPPLKNDVNLYNYNDKHLSFIENENYKDKSKLGEKKNIGVLKSDSSADIQIYNYKKYNVRIYYKDKMNNNIMENTEIELNYNDHIKDILNCLVKKNLISFQNKDSYYFTEHNKDNNEKNQLNFDLCVQSLNCFELDLNLKKDDEKYNNIINKYEDLSDSNEVDDDNKEYVFNPILAGKYQEFEVIKINKLKNKQERILGIDLYNIYNSKPKNNKNELLKKIFKDETKIPLRKIKDVVDCVIMGDKKFYIEFKNEDKKEKKTKKIFFEVKNNNIRNEIVAKIKFLMTLNNDK
jgi:hypothetical protein